MFNSISGEISGRAPSSLFLKTGGVEWELEVSAFTHRELAASERARLFTCLYHREDQMRLYGFSSPEERRVFLELTRVSGIGPRAAMKILSATSPGRLVRMLETEDVEALVLLPGLGRKTAQKIILALRGRLVAGAAPSPAAHAELVEGLVEMGFDRARVTEAVARIAFELEDEDGGEESEREIFRRAIVLLSE